LQFSWRAEPIFSFVKTVSLVRKIAKSFTYLQKKYQFSWSNRHTFTAKSLILRGIGGWHTIRNVYGWRRQSVVANNMKAILVAFKIILKG
jgi:hypothetical protein